MVSYDVCDLFSNIPLSIILENKKDLKFSENELTKLFRFATSQMHFYFDAKIFHQVDGVAMGSPLGPALANWFMGYNEQKLLESYHGRLNKFYRRYVDDIFCFWKRASGSDFPWFFKQSTPEYKFHYRKGTHEITPIFGFSQYSFRQINYQCL